MREYLASSLIGAAFVGLLSLGIVGCGGGGSGGGGGGSGGGTTPPPPTPNVTAIRVSGSPNNVTVTGNTYVHPNGGQAVALHITFNDSSTGRSLAPVRARLSYNSGGVLNAGYGGFVVSSVPPADTSGVTMSTGVGLAAQLTVSNIYGALDIQFIPDGSSTSSPTTNTIAVEGNYTNADGSIATGTGGITIFGN